MDNTTLVIERTFNAPRERVWQMWTEPEHIKQWWGPKQFTAPVVKQDFRVGGTYLYCMRGAMAPGMPEQDFYSGGTFTDVVPMEKIVATDHFTDSEGNRIDPKEVGMPGEWPEEMYITTVFEDADDGMTKVTITHEGHPKDIIDGARQGWNEQLDKLAELLG